MVCIYCDSKTRIINSRPQKRLGRTWRRHACEHCKTVFTTIEAPDLYESWLVTHKEGILSPFERDTLFLSIFDSLKHRDDAISTATSLTTTVLAKLLASTKSATITTDTIIVTTLQVLGNFDTVAHVYYSAFHKRSQKS